MERCSEHDLCRSGPPYDTGGLRFDNNTNQTITLNHVTVDIGTRHYDPWNLNLSVPANGTLILAGATGAGAFNTSEANGVLKTGGGGGSSGFTATQWATGFFSCCGGFGLGPVGVAFDVGGNLFVMNYMSGFLYKFGPGGGVSGPSTQVNAVAIQGCPAGLAFSKDGKHLYLAVQCQSTVVEIDQVTGVVLRTLASGISGATGLATDPLSGDLFVSQPNGTPTIQRIQNPLSASPTVSVYSSPGTTDGIAFGPDGSLYGSVGGGQVVIIAGTNAASPGTVLTRIQNSTALAGNDGIALLPPPPGAVGTSIVVNSNNGVLVEIDNPQTATPTFHNIFTGGSRGDFAAVGPDGCLYATQTASVIKVTASDGTCPFIPSICLPNPVIPQVHVTINGFTFNYNDSGQALNSGGIDGECNGTNESQAWQQIGGKGGPVNIPLPPAMTLALQAAPSNGHIVGQSQAFTVAAMDGAGHTVPNVAVQLSVFGANPQQLSGTTDLNGTATFSYIGSNAGTDTVTAIAFISGLRTVSNGVPIQWTIPAPGGPTGTTSGPAPPSVVITSPADGTPVSVPTPVTATVTPPSSSSISSWSVTYQNVSGGSPITIASGSGNPPATLATFDPTGLAAGTYAITVTVTTAAGGGAFPVTRVIVGGGGGTAAQAPPTITAASPADGTIVTKPVPVTATITPPTGQSISSWSVRYQAQDLEPAVTIAGGTGTPPSPLAIFDPTLLPNDTYAILVTATASGGGTQTLSATVAVFGALKLGRFTTTYQDMNVPVNGFQMQIRRTYDSIDKRVGDFGFGWHLDLGNFRVSANRQLGAAGWTEYPTTCVLGLCFYGFKTTTPHYVTVTFPDGHQEIFDFTPQGGAGILYWQGSAAFRARPGTGTTSTLEVAGDSGLSYDFAGNLMGGSGYYNPTRFKLTTKDKRVLILDTVLGLISETDASGNSLTIDSSGVHSSTGRSLTYTKDSLNRITLVTGPSGEKYQYSYSNSGDLASSTDPNANTTTYSYDAQHRLLSSTGPGSTPLRSEQYDSAGRLTSVQIGAGTPFTIANNIGAQTQVIQDPTGQLTTIDYLDDLGDLVREDQNFGSTSLTTRYTYDATGHVLSRVDPLGRTWTGAYDPSGNLGTFTNPSGASATMTFDAVGNPTSLVDAAGATTTYSYTPAGLLSKITDPLGKSQAIGYDNAGHVNSFVDKNGKTSSYAYDAAGNMTAATDQLGNTTTYAYDASGHLTSVTNPLGAQTTYTYDADGNLLSVRDPLGRVTTYGYDGLSRVTSKTDPLSNTVRYTYDPGFSQLATVTDALGNMTRYTYDADGRITSMTDPLGGVVSYAYDPVGRLTSLKDALGRTTTYVYDAAGRRTGETLANGGTLAFTYDAAGNQVSSTDPMGRITKSAFDGNRRLTSTTDALGQSTTITRDAVGRPTKVVDALGNTTTMAYDANGRLVGRTDPAGATTSFTYDAAGRQVSITDALGRKTNRVYDAANRLTTVIDPLGRTSTYSYDGSGQIISRTSPAGGVTSYVYDLDGRRTSITDPLGNKGTATYDAGGREISSLDPRGAKTSYSYDADGRRTVINDAAGGAVQFAYDTGGQLTKWTDPLGHATTFTYDALGDINSRSDPATGTQKNAFDAAGELTSHVNGNGVTTTYGYDGAGRVSQVNYAGSVVSYAYDPAGRRTSMADPTGTTTFLYDADSRVTSISAPNGTSRYAYDAAGERSSMDLGSGHAVSYAYDAGGQLSALTDWSGRKVSVTHDDDGNIIGIQRPNGVATTLNYDAADQVTSIKHATNTAVIANYAYTYDANGNRTSVTSGAGSEAYSFDALNRLTKATYPNGDVIGYTYDAAGNRLTKVANATTTSYTYDNAGRLTSDGTNGYTYDAAGNLATAGGSSFSYDAASRMSSSTVAGTTANYAYDGDGRRTSTSTGAGTTTYSWDRLDSVPQLVIDGSTLYLHLLGTAGLAEQIDPTGGATYPFADALGSIRGLLDGAGNVTGTASFDAFGSLRSQTGVSSIFGFTGEQTDPTKLLFLRARYLNTDLGRFQSPDSAQPNAPGTQGYGLYSYVANNPATLTDPRGLCAPEARGPPEGEAPSGERASASTPQPGDEATERPATDPVPEGDGGVKAPEAPVDNAEAPRAPGDVPRAGPKASGEPPVTGVRETPAVSDPAQDYLALLSISLQVMDSLKALGQQTRHVLTRSSIRIQFAVGAGALNPPGAGGRASGSPAPGEALSAAEEPSGTPISEQAANSQASARKYGNTDAWGNTTLQPGDTIYQTRNPDGSIGEFFAGQDLADAAGTDARAYNEGAQVSPYRDKAGNLRYADHVEAYKVTRPIPAATSTAQAHTDYGAGGYRQYYVPPEYHNALEHEGSRTMQNTTPRPGITPKTEDPVGPRGSEGC